MSQLATLIVFLFPLAYSPGPGNLFFAASGARFGFRATLRANAGYHVVTWVVTVLIGLGMLRLGAAAPQAFASLRILCSAYVLWLAYRLATAGMIREQTAQSAGFLTGALLLLLNPKAYVIIALMFTQFLDPARGQAVGDALVLTTVFTLNNLVAFCLRTLLGDALGRLFRSPRDARRLNACFAGLLAATAIWIALM